MKQAYLICTHGSFNLLEKLIQQLDYPDNDLFVHIDKKVKNIDFCRFQNLTKFSKVICLKNRISISWGGYSQVAGDILLLETALKNDHYDYFHLMSGVDFPIKSNAFIKAFLEENNGKEFVGFSGWHPTLDFKLGYYHLIPMSLQRQYKFFSLLAKIILKTQKILKIKNNKQTKSFSKGCNWWSITEHLAKEIVKRKEKFEKIYKYTSCCDEIFLHTFIMQNKDFYQLYCEYDEYKGCARLIDWKRGNPYVWQVDDIEYMLSSEALFARKFDEKNMKVVDQLMDVLK